MSFVERLSLYFSVQHIISISLYIKMSHISGTAISPFACLSIIKLWRD